MSVALTFLIMAWASEGCLSGEPKIKVVKPKQQPEQLNATNGSDDVFGPWPKHEKRWTVNWKTTTLEGYQSKGISTGEMFGVTGTIYKNQQPALDFKADRGDGDKAHELLTLRDHVTASKPGGGATLTADQMQYLAKKKLLVATGHVHLTGAGGSGTFSQLVATSDLSEAGTPDMFDLR